MDYLVRLVQTEARPNKENRGRKIVSHQSNSKTDSVFDLQFFLYNYFIAPFLISKDFAEKSSSSVPCVDYYSYLFCRLWSAQNYRIVTWMKKRL